jgi:hypothetical protein
VRKRGSLGAPTHLEKSRGKRLAKAKWLEQLDRKNASRSGEVRIRQATEAERERFGL